MLNKDIIESLRRSVGKIQEASKDLGEFMKSSISNIDVIPFEVNLKEGAPPVSSIDGSYQCLWKYPGLPIWLIHVRTAIAKRKYDEKHLKYITVDDISFDRFEVVDMMHGVKYVNGDVPIILSDVEMKLKDIKTFSSFESIQQEEEVAMRLSKESKNEVILFDGALSGYPISDYKMQFDRSYEESQRIMKGIMKSCKENGNVIIGISKDSSLKTINGKTMDEELLDIYGKQIGIKMGYHVVDEGIQAKIGVCFAKLHQDAMKWFRIDHMISDIASLEEILGTVSKYSQVNLMPGTPVPPLQAHDIAVEARQLKDYIDSLMLTFFFDLGLPEDQILGGLTDLNGNPVKGSHHDFLDNFTKVSREEGFNQ